MPDATNYIQIQAGHGLRPLSVTSGMLSSGTLTVPIDTSSPAGALLDLDNGVSLGGLQLTENSASINGWTDVVCSKTHVRVRSGTATLIHEDSNATAANRLSTSTGSNVTVEPGDDVFLLYDHVAARWGVYKNSPATTSPVTSVNGETGAVVLNAADVGADASGTAAAAVTAHENAADPHTQYTTAAEATAAAPVQSVNGETGVVMLDAADVGADAAGTATGAVSTHEAATNPHPQYIRALRYSGTTSGSGTYSVTFSTPFSNTPNVQADLIGGTANQFYKVTSRSTTGFTITCYTRPVVSVLGIEVLAGTPNVTNGLTVDVTVTSNDS